MALKFIGIDLKWLLVRLLNIYFELQDNFSFRYQAKYVSKEDTEFLIYINKD